MALGDTYAHLAELKSYLKLTDAIDDTEMESALLTASREIERFCERQFNKADVASSRLFVGTGLRLQVHDFYAVDDLEVASGVGYESVKDASAYTVWPLNGIVDGEAGWPFYRLYGTFPYGSMFQVTAKWGWSEVPAPVKQACLVMASEVFKGKDAPFGVAGYGEYGMIRVKNSPIAMRMLSPYRRRPVKVA